MQYLQVTSWFSLRRFASWPYIMSSVNGVSVQRPVKTVFFGAINAASFILMTPMSIDRGVRIAAR